VTRAEGCLSGTLGFLTHRLSEGAAFSEAVREAVEAGYTEPDPYADLSGEDVARKGIILGRLAGLADGSTPVRLEGLVDASLQGLPLETFLARCAELDGAMAQRVSEARDRGEVIRYRAQVTGDGIDIGPVAVPLDSPLGGLKGSDNMIVFHSERYDSRPLVVTGPGAGVAVTAMGVLGDILRTAAQRSAS
jgi:homoserine dehydrogenase